MRLYFKHIFLQLITQFALINSVFISIISLVQLLKFIYLVNNGAILGDIIDIVFLSLPSILFILLPVSTCLSILYCYNNLIKIREIHILRSIGLNNFQIARPGLIFAIVITAISYYLALSMAPTFFTKLKDKIFEIRNNYSIELIQENSFNKVNKNLTIYLGKKLNKSSFENVIIFDSIENSKLFVAKSADIKLNNGILELQLNDGVMQNIVDLTKKHLLEFSEFNIKIDLTKNTINRNSKDIGEYFLPELFYSQNPKFLAEAHQRILWPLYTFLLALCSLSILLSKAQIDNQRKIVMAMYLLIVILIYFILHILTIKYQHFAATQYAWFLSCLGFAMIKINSAKAF
jgi:lipopolysaccharide export system permease protein